MKTLKEIKAEMRYSMSSTDIEAGYLDKRLTCHEKEIMVQFLLQFYRDAPDLLREYFQHESDACLLEASEMEELEDNFYGFVSAKF